MAIPRFKPRSISATIEKLTRPVFGKRGFGQISIIANWGKIVGPVFENRTFPEKITYPRGQKNNGTMYLRVNSPALALELQHMETQILERINTYFGYHAIRYIKMTQGEIPDRGTRRFNQRKTISKKEIRLLENKLNIVSDPNLKAALRGLGEEIKIQKNIIVENKPTKTTDKKQFDAD